MKPDLCIYHANCMDGFTAAWVVDRGYSTDVELFPAAYGEAPPDVAGKHVLIVDFSYAHDVLVAMGQAAASVTVLDHHKTAAAALAPFEAGPFADHSPFDAGVKVRAHFDMNKSGARLAWEYMCGGLPAPDIVLYTEDRDLWRWALPESRAINAALGVFTQDLEQWDALAAAAELAAANPETSILTFEGKAILAQRDKDIDAIIETSWRWMVIGGHRVPVANAPFFLASDIGNKLGEGNSFAATYFDDSKGERVFSLRSPTEGEDVSAVAKLYGGGGHFHAAGFKRPRGWEGDL